MNPAAKLWAAAGVFTAAFLARDVHLIATRRESASSWYGRHALVMDTIAVGLLIHFHSDHLRTFVRRLRG